MRPLIAGLLSLALAGFAAAQQPAPAAAPRPEKTFISAAEVQALMAAAIEKKPAQNNYGQPLLTLAPYNINLEYRHDTGAAGGVAHKGEDELIAILDGTATMIIGGTIVNGKIEGGKEQKVAKGDFVIVPENTPHTFTAISEHFFDLAMHVPSTLPAK
jgi:mannose-6-phosphate isomerase-like protein (cupin superfamily)